MLGALVFLGLFLRKPRISSKTSERFRLRCSAPRASIYQGLGRGLWKKHDMESEVGFFRYLQISSDIFRWKGHLMIRRTSVLSVLSLEAAIMGCNFLVKHLGLVEAAPGLRDFQIRHIRKNLLQKCSSTAKNCGFPQVGSWSSLVATLQNLTKIRMSLCSVQHQGAVSKCCLRRCLHAGCQQ